MLISSSKKSKRFAYNKLLVVAAFALSLFVGVGVKAHVIRTTAMPLATEQVGVTVSYQTFYDELSPYGAWTQYGDYGYVWHPSLQGDFTPYGTHGHWVYTDAGWTWVSDYHWGWAPFHYGRWNYDDGIGWFWIPGYDWAPAWVSWGSCNGYYGWAPLPYGIGFGVYMGGYRPPYNYWSFCRYNDFGRPGGEYIYGRRSNEVYGGRFDNVTVINNYNRGGGGGGFAVGPRREDVERVTHNPVHPMTIANSNRPDREAVNGNQVSMYRPAVSHTATAHYAPRHIEPVANVRAQHAAYISSPAHANEWSHTNNAPKPQAHDVAGPAKMARPQENNTHTAQPAQHTSAPMQHNTQPAQHQQAPMQHNTQPAQHQQAPMQHNTQPAQHTAQPAQHQQAPMQHNAAPVQHQQAPMQQHQQAPRQQAPMQQHQEAPRQEEHR